MAVSKESARSMLQTLGRISDSFEGSMKVLHLIKSSAIKSESHARAIKAATAIRSLQDVLEEIRVGQHKCMQVLGAVKIPIKNEDKPVHLRLVVDNTRKEKV